MTTGEQQRRQQQRMGLARCNGQHWWKLTALEGLPLRAHNVGRVLADNAGPELAWAPPISQRRIAELAGCSVRTVKRAFQDLRAAERISYRLRWLRGSPPRSVIVGLEFFARSKGATLTPSNTPSMGVGDRAKGGWPAQRGQSTSSSRQNAAAYDPVPWYAR